MSLRLALVLVVLASFVAPWCGVTTAGSEPTFVAVYPNPVVADDAGEYVVVQFPRPTNLSGWTLDDGESRLSLPNVSVRGRVVLTADADPVGVAGDRRVVEGDGHLSLANDGETVRLLRGNRTVDRTAYRNAPESERWVRTDGEWMWEPRGVTDLPIDHGGPARVEAFVLPDDPTVAVRTIRSAESRILLAGYSFGSTRVATELRRAADRGVRVVVLVEGSPVGGLSEHEGRLLDSLVAASVEVRVLGGPRARYDFHHAKYAVVDDRAVVLSENWKPAGTGGRSSRGWGVVIDDANVSAAIAAVFRADTGWRDTTTWESFRRNASFTAVKSATGRFPRRFASEKVAVDSVRVLVAPDNAGRGLGALLGDADESIRIQQLSIGNREQPLLRATLAAARRGITVRILLSGAWYVEDENRRLARWLNGRARVADLPLAARVADPRGRFEKIHNKGVIVDGEHVVVGSINWNNHSLRENRELAVVLSGEEVGEYYGRVFRADWRGAAWRLPIGFGAAVVLCVAIAGRIGSERIRFEER